MGHRTIEPFPKAEEYVEVIPKGFSKNPTNPKRLYICPIEEPAPRCLPHRDINI